MNKHNIKKKLRRVYEHATPDVWDAVLSDCKQQKGNMIMVTTKQKPSKFKQYAGLVACLCLMIGAAFSFFSYRANHTVDATVSLDVNPSIEIEVNKKDRVIQVIPLNEDGRNIIGDLNFSGSELKVTVYALIGSMVQNGYLSELSNSILISVDNKDPARCAALQEQLSSEVNEILQKDSLHGAILSQTVHQTDLLQQLAKPYGISGGRAQLIQAILSQSDAHTFDDLATLSVNELNLLLNADTAAASNFEVFGTASDKAYIGEAKAKEIALENAGVSADSLTVFEIKLDIDDGALLYDVEFVSENYKYAYEIDATTGKILDFERELIISASQFGLPANCISADNAKQIVLQHAGLDAASVSGFQCELDLDDGAAVYEIEFYANGFEYDYKINAVTGDVLKAEKEAKGSVANPAPTQPSNPQPTSQISTDKAKEIALQHAGVVMASISGFKCELDTDDGMAIYEIEFYASGFEYDYKINAVTGDVLKAEKEAKGSVVNPVPTQPSNPQPTSQISTDKAKEIALQHADVDAASISGFRCELDMDDGVALYEIEFYANGFEYDYEINAATGSIVKSEKEAKDTTVTQPSTPAPAPAPTQPSNSQPSTDRISADTAKEIALRHAGVSTANVYGFKCELDTEDGVTIYEIEFISGGYEYNYEINAATGAVVEFDKKRDD